MKLKKIHVTFLLLITATIFGEVNRESYFPLIKDSKYVYNYSFSGKRGTSSMIIKSSMLGRTPVYYSVEDYEANDANPIIGCNLPGLGLYYIKNNNLMTIECFWKEELKDIDIKGSQLMITFPHSTGDVATVLSERGERKTSFTIIGTEKVTVPAGTFTCIKIKKEAKRDEESTPEVGFIWLAKGVGVVKWQNATGRVDKLVSYSLGSK